MQVAIEAVIDVGESLIGHMGWRAPKSYREISLILFENKAISKEQKELLEKAVSLRSILVHNYVYLTPDELYDDVRSLANSLTGIVDSILSYMEKGRVTPK